MDIASAKLPNTQIHDLPNALQTSSNPFRLQPRCTEPLAFVFFLVPLNSKHNCFWSTAHTESAISKAEFIHEVGLSKLIKTFHETLKSKPLTEGYILPKFWLPAPCAKAHFENMALLSNFRCSISSSHTQLSLTKDWSILYNWKQQQSADMEEY